MANILRRFIQPDEVVVLNSVYHGKKFICKEGPGMNPKARGVSISGLWEDGKEGLVGGFSIDPEATQKLKEQS
jgi:hypothetical protein